MHAIAQKIPDTTNTVSVAYCLLNALQLFEIFCIQENDTLYW
jgi:hypothetical protein